MKKRIQVQASLSLGTMLIATTVVRANTTITFDSLTPDFSSYGTYTEFGYTLAATSPGNHFYAVSSPDLSSTAAQIFSLDGAPQQLTAGGGNFTFKSIDIVQIDPGVTVDFVGSNGTTESSSTVGTVSFGSAFNNVQWVQIKFGATPSGTIDSSFIVDNLTVVPEPSQWSLAVGSLCLVGTIIVRAHRK